MPKVTFTRKPGWFGRVRVLHLLADKYHLGTLKSGETKTFDVPENAKDLRGKMDWAKTTALPLAFLEDGAHFTIVTWFTFNPLRNLGIMPMPMRFEANEDIALGDTKDGV